MCSGCCIRIEKEVIRMKKKVIVHSLEKLEQVLKVNENIKQPLSAGLPSGYMSL